MQTHLYYIATHKTSYAMAQLCQNIRTTKNSLISDIYMFLKDWDISCPQPNFN